MSDTVLFISMLDKLNVKNKAFYLETIKQLEKNVIDNYFQDIKDEYESVVPYLNYKLTKTRKARKLYYKVSKIVLLAASGKVKDAVLYYRTLTEELGIRKVKVKRVA